MTVTRPSAISSSHTRREPDPDPGQHLLQPLPGGQGWRAGSAQPSADRAHLLLELGQGLGPGEQVLDRRQLIEAVEAEPLQEGVGGGVEDGLARARGPPHRGDVAPVLEQADHPVDVDPAEGGDLGPGHRLLVGHDGQGLEGGGRQAGRHAHVGEPLDVGGQVGVGLDAVAAGDP